jgi:hypothetical protein
MATKRISVPVVTRLQDNGDGGYTMYAFNDENELIANHPKSRKWDYTSKPIKEIVVELSAEEREAILTEDDPYKNGYIDEDTIELEMDDDTGTIRLAKPLSFHAGQ